MRKILLTIIISIFLISFTTAAISDLGTFKVNTCIELPQTSPDATYNNISKITTDNELTIVSGEVVMTKIGTYFNYTFCNTTLLGEYIVNGYGDEGGTLKTWEYTFNISYLGKELSTSQSIIYLGLLGILLFILFATFFGMRYLPKSNVQDEYGRILSINHLKHFRLVLWLFAYFLFTAIIFLSSNVAFAFVQEQLFARILFGIFSVLMAISPVIIICIVISFFVRFYHDKEFQKMLNRGIYPEGKL